MATNGNPMILERMERVETKIDRIETTVNHIAGRVTALEEKVDAQGRGFDVQMEGLRETITTFADNIGGRLDAISEQMTDKHKTTEARFSDDEAILRDHSRRITAIERRPRRRT